MDKTLHPVKTYKLASIFGSLDYEFNSQAFYDRTTIVRCTNAIDQLRWITKGRDLDLTEEHQVTLSNIIVEDPCIILHSEYLGRGLYRSCREIYIHDDIVKRIEWESMVVRLTYLLDTLSKEEVARAPGWEYTRPQEIVEWTETDQELIALLQEYFLVEGSHGKESRF